MALYVFFESWFHAGFPLVPCLKNKKWSSMKPAWTHGYVWNLYTGILTILYTEAFVAQWQHANSKLQRSEVRIPAAPPWKMKNESSMKPEERRETDRSTNKHKKEKWRKKTEERTEKKEKWRKKTRRNKHERSMKAR